MNTRVTAKADLREGDPGVRRNREAAPESAEARTPARSYLGHAHAPPSSDTDTCYCKCPPALAGPRARPGRCIRSVALAPLLALLGATRPAHAENDHWFGSDKALHFGVSAALGGGGYAASSLFLEPPWQRATAGASFALTLGAAKELHDLAGHGDPSWRDFTWDVAGTAVGVGLALVLDLLLSPDDDTPRSSASPLATARAPDPLVRF